MAELCTVVVAPKEWYSWAVEQLWAVLETSPCAELIYLLSPPFPAELADALAAAQARHPHLRVLRLGLLENPYAMRQRAAEDVRTRYAAFLGNDTFPTAGWLEALVAVAEARLECAVVQPIILERSVTHDDTLHVWWHPLRLLDHEDGRSPQLLTRFDEAATRHRQPALQQRLGPEQRLQFVEDHALLVRCLP